MISLAVPEEEHGKRIDAYLASALPDISRTLAARLVSDGMALVDGQRVKPSHRVSVGETINVQVILPPSLSAAPEDIPLDIVYRDSDVAVVDKPAGLVVHPAAGHASGTLANALAHLFPQTANIGDEERPGIVHRLDKDTSGLMAVALSPRGYSSLQGQIAERTAERRYLALLRGHPRPAAGTIDAPIGRDPRDRKRMAVYGIAARPARTTYRVLEERGDHALVEAKLETGRTHQIRAHMAAIGHPIVGDPTYGGPSFGGLERQFLHAYRLGFLSPATGEPLLFESPLPPDLAAVLSRLGMANPSP